MSKSPTEQGSLCASTRANPEGVSEAILKGDFQSDIMQHFSKI